jgi:hypothetical protein
VEYEMLSFVIRFALCKLLRGIKPHICDATLQMATLPVYERGSLQPETFTLTTVVCIALRMYFLVWFY